MFVFCEEGGDVSLASCHSTVGGARAQWAGPGTCGRGQGPVGGAMELWVWPGAWLCGRGQGPGYGAVGGGRALWAGPGEDCQDSYL